MDLQAILSAVIVMSLKGVMLQMGDFWGYYKVSKLDGLLWMGTFLGVVFTTVDTGLIICIGLTIFVMTYRNYQINIIELDHANFNEDEVNNDDEDAAEDSRNGDDHDEDRIVPGGSNVDHEEGDDSEDSGHVLALKINGVISFANYEKVLKKCNKRIRKQRLRMGRLVDTEKPVSRNPQ